MGSYVTNVLKKKAKQMHIGYVKLKRDKTSKKWRKNENCDKSGLYEAEPSEELYENLAFIPDCEIDSNDSDFNRKKPNKFSLSIPCSSKNSSNDSHDNLLESPCSSLDSGISSTPPGFKKLKKLQFSADSDEIYVFEPNTLEKSSYREPSLSGQQMDPRLYKTKVYEGPTAEKVKIVNQALTDRSNISESTTKIPFNHLRLKQSIVSPKTYQRTSKRTYKTAGSNSFLGNFAQRSSQCATPKKSAYVKKQNLDKSDISLRPLLKSPPEKPPRTARDLRKVSQDLPRVNASQNNANNNEAKWTSLSYDLRVPKIDENGYSIPFDMKKNHQEMSSSPFRKLSSGSQEPVYAEVVKRSSRNAEKIVSSSSTDVTKHVYSLATPRNVKNIHMTSTEIQSLSTTENSYAENIQNSEHLTSSSVSPIAAVESPSNNDILLEVFKELNMTHKTNRSFKKGDITHEHECHNKNKTPEEVCLEEKFVVNMFQSRPSKRWEKHIRNMDRHSGNQDENFNRNVSTRLSLDSRKGKAKCFENNVRIIKNNFMDVDKEIEKLEKEAKDLERVSKKIEKELQRMDQQDNEAYSRTLEREKLRIEKEMNKLNNNVDETSIKLTNKSKRIEKELEQIKSDSTEDYNKYKMLKKSRDIECSRMTQASRALEEIKNRRGRKDWLEVLVAERTLLETSEKVHVLTQQIRDSTYTTIPEPPLHKGTIHLSDIKFPFAKEFRGNTKREKHHTDFFVMTLSYGTQIFVSEFITGESDPLSFSRNHIFKNVKPDFEIKVKLFHVRLRTSDEYFWEKFHYYHLCPTSQIIYEDLLTHQFQEKTVYMTSFKLCAETTLTRTHINDVTARLDTKPEAFGKLDTQIEFSLKCEDVDIVARLSGFLDLGTLCRETYFWEKKWCVLDGPNLMLYNYPQEADFGKPFEQINLEYCFGPIITKVDNCPKRRSFHLKTGRPNDLTNIEDSKHTLKTKPNFTLRKFYFAATNMEEYLSWTVEVEKILNSLSDFKQLAFGEEYAEYLRH